MTNKAVRLAGISTTEQARTKHKEDVDKHPAIYQDLEAAMAMSARDNTLWPYRNVASVCVMHIEENGMRMRRTIVRDRCGA